MSVQSGRSSRPCRAGLAVGAGRTWRSLVPGRSGRAGQALEADETAVALGALLAGRPELAGRSLEAWRSGFADHAGRSDHTGRSGGATLATLAGRAERSGLTRRSLDSLV